MELDLSLRVVLFGFGDWGGGMQANYAAGNAFLDALAQQRRDRGLVGTSVAWGPWAGGGMAAGDAERQLRRAGLSAMAPELAVSALGQAISGDQSCVTVADVDWSRFAAGFTATRPSPLIADLPEVAALTHTTDTAPSSTSPTESAALRQRIASMTPAEQHKTLLELVQREVAAELDHPTPDAIQPQRAFRDLGFDSLAAVRLRNRIANQTGLALPASLVFEHRSPTVLADHLATCLKGSKADQFRPSPLSAAHESQDTLGAIYRKIALRGNMKEAEGLLIGAASLRETFEDPAVVRDSIGVIRLAQGNKQPALICFGPFAPVEGSIQFARFSNYFEGLRDVWVVSLPGFLSDEPLASSLDVLVEAVSEAVVRCAAGAPFVLLGYSSSGWVAHSVASFLASSGTRPSGLVLLDTYLPDSMSQRFRKAMNYEVIVRRESFATLEYSGLTAMGVYRGLFRSWEPARVDTPTLVVRPTECIPGSPGEPLTEEEWHSVWPLPHVSVEVPGDHCTMIGEYAPHTAETVHRWLADIPGLA